MSESTLRSKTIPQLKLIIRNFVLSTGQSVRIPTRKDDIIQLIIANNMYPTTESNNDTTINSSNNNVNSTSKKRLEREDDDKDTQEKNNYNNNNTDTNNNNNNKNGIEKMEMESEYANILKSLQDMDRSLMKNTVPFEDLFKTYFKLDYQEFIDTKYPAKGVTKCPNYLFRRFHFICLTCSKSKENTYFCVECFLDGNHMKDNHNYSISFSSALSTLCDCGNPDAMHKDGFCQSHRHADDYERKEIYMQSFPDGLKQALVVFFTKLIQHVAYLGANSKSYFSNENTIADIITYLGKCSTKSPLFAQIIAERLTLQELNYKTFDLLHPVPLDQQQDTKRQKLIVSSSSNGINSGSRSKVKSPLQSLFTSHLEFTTKCFYLFSVLSAQHKFFAQIFFQLYMDNFSHLIRAQRSIALTESCFHFQLFFRHPSSIIIPFVNRQSESLISTVARSASYNLLTIRNSFTTNKVSPLISRYDHELLSKSMVFPECAQYTIHNSSAIEGLLNLCAILHGFITPENQFNNILRDLKDIALLENAIINCFNKMFIKYRSNNQNNNNNNNNELMDIAKNIIKIMEKSVQDIKKPEWLTLNGNPGTRFIFPLPRILAIIKIHTRHLIDQHHQQQQQISLYNLEANLLNNQEFVVETVVNIFIFRILFYSHCTQARVELSDNHVVASPKDEERRAKLYTSKSMVLDFFTLQMIVVNNVDRFVEIVFDTVLKFIPSNQDTLKSFLEVIINILQCRVSLMDPTDEELIYHYVQAASTGFFFYTEMLESKFMYNTISLERRKRLIEMVVEDVNAPVMKLKPTMWERYDHYYWYFQFYYKVELQEKSREAYLEYQRSMKIPESVPSLPPTLPPQSDSQLQSTTRLLESKHFHMGIHYILLKMVHKDFTGYQNSKFKANDFLKNTNSSNISSVGDIYYIYVLAINNFIQQFKQWDDNEKSILDQKLKCLNNNNNNRKGNQDQQQNIIEIMVLNQQTILKKDSSILDTLIHSWKNHDQHPLLKYILKSLSDINPEIAQYIRSKEIILVEQSKDEEQIEEKERKLALQKRKEEILKQMKEKQNSFLKTQNISIRKSNPGIELNSNNSSTNKSKVNKPTTNAPTTPSTTTTTTTTSTLNNSNNNIEDTTDCNLCIICRDKNNHEPLYFISKMTNCALTKNQKKESLKQIYQELPNESILKNQLDPIVNQSPLDQNPPELEEGERESNNIMDILLRTQPKKKTPMFYNKKILSGDVLNGNKSLVDFYQRYYRLPKYISSCHHLTHKSCISKSIGILEFGFKCPLCSTHSNIIIPTDTTKLKIQDATTFILSFRDSNETYTSFERHLWGVVYSNLEVFELKTRSNSYFNQNNQINQINNNNNSNNYGNDYILTELEFKNELSTLKLLFTTIMSCEIPPFPEDKRKLPMIFNFQLDPVFLTTYLVFLKRCSHDEAIKQSIDYTLFNFVMMESNLRQKTPQEIYDTLNGNNKVDQYLFPVFRKLALYKYLFMFKNISSQDNLPTITIQSFNNHEFIYQLLGYKAEQIIPTNLLTKKDFQSLLKESSGLVSKYQNNYIFNLPISYHQIARFVELDYRFIDLILKNIPNSTKNEIQYICRYCNNTQSFKCLSCGSLCCYDCSNSYIAHSNKCYAGVHHVYFFIEITTGLIKVLDVDNGLLLYSSTDYISIYGNERGEPSTMTNNQLVLNQSKLLTVYKKYIQMISTNTTSSLNSF